MHLLRQRDAGLSWEAADFPCVAAGQTGFCPSRPPSSASALLTEQHKMGFCAERCDVEVKHHCSVTANPLVL